MAAAAPARKKVAGRGSQAAGTRSARNAQALQRARTAHKTKAHTAPARRKSGPVARPKTAARPKPRPAPRAPRPTTRAPRPATRAPRPATRTVARPIARAAQSGGSVVLDRLLRGRGWVLLIGVLLAGIVFLNVSVLELNRGIAQTDAAAEKLERKNSRLRERVASLDSTERIQELAEARGFVLPAPGDVEYLDPNRAKDARLAAERMETPDEVAAVAPAVPETPAPEPVAPEPEPAPAATVPTAYTPEPTTAVAPTTP